MAIEYNFTLDMDRSKRDNNIAYARTGDIDSITINADLVFGGTTYTPSGTNAFFECITPNGRSVRASAEKTGSSVSVEVPSAAFQAAGVINVAYFRFESGASDNPTYVESTEPFAIVVREGIGDNIDAGDYIEEWRKLADQLEAAVAEVEKKAEQAETAINEQKTEVDQLKAQAQKAIAGDVTEVEGAAQSAIAAINQEKADVADAAEGVSTAGEQAINTFKTNSQQAISQFNTNGTSAINQFNTDSTAAVKQFNSKGTTAVDKFGTDSKAAIDQFNTDAGSKLDEVDGMITEAQGDVDAAITQLETATGKAVSAMEDALDGTTAGSLQNAINRTLKLDIADMVNIPDNSSMSSFTNVGSYCCKTAATAATVGDCPIDDSPFNMYVFSSATSGQVMQLVVPIDLNGKPTAEWHVRFGTSSAMDPWSVIGGGADIAAGLGIDVTGDAQKTVSLDTTAFYQHHEAAGIIQGFSKVTGGGRIKELRVKGRTVKNLWPVINKSKNDVTASTDGTGLITVTGTAAGGSVYLQESITSVVPGRTVTLRISKAILGSTGITQVYLRFLDSSGTQIPGNGLVGIATTTTTITTTVLDGAASVLCGFETVQNGEVNWSGRVMLVEGSEAPDCFTPTGLHSVEPTNLVTAGKNLFPVGSDNGWYRGGYSLSIAFIERSKPVTLPYTSIAEPDGVGNAFRVVAGQAYTLTVTGYPKNFPTGLCWALYKTLEDADDPMKAVKWFSAGDAQKTNTTDVLPISGYLVVCVAGEWSDGSTNVGKYPKGMRIQCELGSTATSYEPPNITTTPLPEVELRGLPDGTRDELVIGADGTCNVERKLVQKTIDVEHPINVTSVEPASGTNLPYVALNDMFAVFDSPNSDVSGTVISTSWPSTTSLKSRGVYRTWNAVLFVDERFTDVETAQNIINKAGGTFVAQVPLSAEHQSPVTLPVLPAPGYTIYATSSVPAEIEAEVVKVDYLPAPDVYTKEEVDRKIEDAGMPAVVPVSKGGTGVTTAAAERNRLGLGNTTDALPVANGGTGKTTAKAAQNALLANINTVSTDVGDDSFFVGYYQSPSDATGALYKRVSSDIWNWIVSKIRSTFGFNSSNVLPVSNGGTGLTKAPSMLVNLESASADNPLASDSRPGVSGELPLTRGGTGGTSAAAARTNLGVYSKAEVDGKVPKVVYGTGNIPSNAENGTIYIQYRS